MTDWIHCNNCFIQPCPSIQFFLTSCGHMFCATCVEKCTKPACCVCENNCNVIPLSAKMDQSVEMYFRNPCDIVKKHTQELQKVLEFQSAHRKRLLTKTKEKLERAKALYNDFKKATTYIQNLERKNKLIAQENDYLKSHSTRGGNPVSSATDLQRQNGRHTLSQLQNTLPFSPHDAAKLGSKFTSPAPNLTSRNGYPHPLPPPPPPATRITVRTPPSGGRMGVMPGSNSSTPGRSQPFYTPPNMENTPNRNYARSPQDSVSWLVNGMHSIGLPNRNQNKLPGSGRSCGSSGEGSIRTATVSPFSPQNTPT